MEAVILAAGYGSRLGHHTKEIPKALLSVGGKPIISYTLEILAKNGIMNITIVTGHRGYRLRKFVSENYDLNVNFVHNKYYRSTNNIYSLYLALENLEETLYIINSDVFFHPKIFEFLHESERKGLILSVDTVKKLGEEEMKVKIEDEKITMISKKIPPSDADGEYIGIAKVSKEVVGDLRVHIETVMKREGKIVFYEEAFQSMIDAGCEVTYESTRGLPWIEIDTPSDLIAAREKIYPKLKSDW